MPRLPDVNTLIRRVKKLAATAQPEAEKTAAPAENFTTDVAKDLAKFAQRLRTQPDSGDVTYDDVLSFGRGLLDR